jgi:3-isopropylmalate dehydratase small subunit
LFGAGANFSDNWAAIFHKNEILNGLLNYSATDKYMSDEGSSFEDDHIN